MILDKVNYEEKTVDVTEDFEEANITVTLKGDTKLNDSSKKVTINDREMAFSSINVWSISTK